MFDKGLAFVVNTGSLWPNQGITGQGTSMQISVLRKREQLPCNYLKIL